MKSETRQQCEDAVKKFANKINDVYSVAKKPKLLYVGLAGDPVGGEYSPLFHGFEVTTFDIDQQWNPDIVGDITKTVFEDESWDVIVCVQTLEHIPNIWDLAPELQRILKKGGMAIVDCPWQYPYHGEYNFGDYWRISKDGMKVLFKSFDIVSILDYNSNTSCLIRKPLS